MGRTFPRYIWEGHKSVTSRLSAFQAAQFPNAGRVVPEFQDENVRELIEGQYRIVYRILPTRIDVLTVMHVAQLLPTDVQGL